MTAHDRLLSEAAKREASYAPLRVRPEVAAIGSDSDTLGDLAQSSEYVIFTPMREELERLLPLAQASMGTGASPDVVYRVSIYNPDSIWAIARHDDSSERPYAIGFAAFLMLREEGVRQLVAGSFSGLNPAHDLLARQSEKPAGIYFWGAYAPGLGAKTLPLALQKVTTPLYRDVNIYARPITPGGDRVVERLCFSRGTSFQGIFAPDLWVHRREALQPCGASPYDTYHPGRSGIGVTVVKTIEDFQRVVSVRAAVYVAEQTCPYEEEFDGNDFCGSHLLGYVDGEPVGCLRIRYFAEFAALERLAVRREFRHHKLGTMLMQAGVELCRAKGYRTIYGRGRKEILGYYLAMGFRPLENRQELSFSDHTYIEIVLDAEPSDAAISLASNPYVLMRPEGSWSRPGILERSASRSHPTSIVA